MTVKEFVSVDEVFAIFAEFDFIPTYHQDGTKTGKFVLSLPNEIGVMADVVITTGYMQYSTPAYMNIDIYGFGIKKSFDCRYELIPSNLTKIKNRIRRISKQAKQLLEQKEKSVEKKDNDFNIVRKQLVNIDSSLNIINPEYYTFDSTTKAIVDVNGYRLYVNGELMTKVNVLGEYVEMHITKAIKLVETIHEITK